MLDVVVVVPGPTSCPCCQGKLSKLGEDVTETLEVIPRRFKVIQTVRERLACRACEAIHQPPAGPPGAQRFRKFQSTGKLRSTSITLLRKSVMPQAWPSGT